MKSCALKFKASGLLDIARLWGRTGKSTSQQAEAKKDRAFSSLLVDCVQDKSKNRLQKSTEITSKLNKKDSIKPNQTLVAPSEEAFGELVDNSSRRISIRQFSGEAQDLQLLKYLTPPSGNWKKPVEKSIRPAMKFEPDAPVAEPTIQRNNQRPRNSVKVQASTSTSSREEKLHTSDHREKLSNYKTNNVTVAGKAPVGVASKLSTSPVKPPAISQPTANSVKPRLTLNMDQREIRHFTTLISDSDFKTDLKDFKPGSIFSQLEKKPIDHLQNFDQRLIQAVVNPPQKLASESVAKYSSIEPVNQSESMPQESRPREIRTTLSPDETIVLSNKLNRNSEHSPKPSNSPAATTVHSIESQKTVIQTQPIIQSIRNPQHGPNVQNVRAVIRDEIFNLKSERTGRKSSGNILKSSEKPTATSQLQTIQAGNKTNNERNALPAKNHVVKEQKVDPETHERRQFQPLQFDPLIKSGDDHSRGTRIIQHSMKSPVEKPVFDPSNFVSHVRMSLSSGRGEITIRLKPEILGSALISLRQEEDGLKIEFEVETPAARQILEAQTPQLKDALINAGIEITQIEIRIADHSQERFAPTDDKSSGNRQQAGSNNNPKGEESSDQSQPNTYPRYLGYNTFDIAA